MIPRRNATVIVIFGTEFGRTSFAQGAIKGNYGRDHHGGSFSVWMAAKDPVHIHDFNATILRTLGIDHERLTFKSQGRDFRLTDVHGKVGKGILA
jgi:hypothetical protein